MNWNSVILKWILCLWFTQKQISWDRGIPNLQVENTAVDQISNRQCRFQNLEIRPFMWLDCSKPHLMSGVSLTQRGSKRQKEQMSSLLPQDRSQLTLINGTGICHYTFPNPTPPPRRPQNRREPPTSMPCPHGTAEAWVFQFRETNDCYGLYDL